MVIAASRLRDELVPQSFNEHRRVSAADVVMAELPIIVESAAEHLSVHSHEDRMMQAARRLNNRSGREAADDLRCHLMKGVLLPQLAIVVSAYTIDLGLLLILALGISFNCYYDGMVVAAGHIKNLLIANRIDEGRG